MLGFQPDAPHDKLYIDPALPDWLPDITIGNLRSGSRKFDIRFWREGNDTPWEVIEGDADRVLRRSFATGIPWPSHMGLTSSIHE